MNIEPCVRLGMRISPKISEKPADSRNNRPPKVTLLTVSSSQNVICGAFSFTGCYARSKLTSQPLLRIAQSELFWNTAPRTSLDSIRAARLQHLVSGG